MRNSINHSAVRVEKRALGGEPVILRLPVPPSVNNLFCNGKNGRYPSPRYVSWQADAGNDLIMQRPRRFTSPVEVIITIRWPGGRHQDADNLAKAPLDLLVKHGVIPTDDDTIVHSVTTRFGNVNACEIEIRESTHARA